MKLNLAFDLDKRMVIGTSELTLSPLRSSSLVELNGKGFNISSIELIGKDSSLSILERDYSDSLVIRLLLNKKLDSNDTLSVSIKYEATPGTLSERGLVERADHQGLYFVNFDAPNKEPKQIWSQGETQSNSAWFPCIDAPNQKTTQDLLITVDTPMVALSNGRLVYMLLNRDGTRTFRWKQDLPHAPYLTMLAVGNFAILEDNGPGDLPISYYVEKEYAQHANMIFGKTPEILSFFSKIYQYPYPWDKYAQVTVRNFVSGAMENTSATTIMSAIQHDSIGHNDYTYEDYIVHELAHQWFGDLVTCESWANTALNEGFATYGEYLWIENQYDSIKAFEKLELFKQGYFAQSEYVVHPLIHYTYSGSADQMFDKHSYNKGALVVHTLRQKLGDAVFFDGIKTYLNDHEFEAVDVDHLRHSFEKASGLDLRAFFSEWFLTENHPRISLSYEYVDSTHSLNIDAVQEQSHAGYHTYDVNLPISVTLEDGTTIYHNIKLDQSQKTFELPIKGSPVHYGATTRNLPLVDLLELKTNTVWFKALASKNFESHQRSLEHFNSVWNELDKESKQKVVDSQINWGRESALADKTLLRTLNTDSLYFDVSPLLKSKDYPLISQTIMYMDKNGQLTERQILDFIELPSYSVKSASIAASEKVYSPKLESRIAKNLPYNSIYANQSAAQLFEKKGSEKINPVFKKIIQKQTSHLGLYASYLSRQKKDIIVRELDFLLELRSTGVSSAIILSAINQLKAGIENYQTVIDTQELMDSIDIFEKKLQD